MSTRIQQLLEFLEKDPNDSFTLYALALEYQKINLQEAIVYFEKLLKEHSNYLPTYYHAAKMYEDLEEKQKVKDIYKKGIELAIQLKDNHAQRELEKAYQLFLYDEE